MVTIITKAKEFIDALRGENAMLLGKLGLPPQSSIANSLVGLSSTSSPSPSLSQMTPSASDLESHHHHHHQHQQQQHIQPQPVHQQLRHILQQQQPSHPTSASSSPSPHQHLPQLQLPTPILSRADSFEHQQQHKASAAFLLPVRSKSRENSMSLDFISPQLAAAQTQPHQTPSSHHPSSSNTSFFLTFREGKPSISRRDSLSQLSLSSGSISSQSGNGNSYLTVGEGPANLSTKRDSLTTSLFSLSTLTEIDFASVSCRLCCQDASKNDMVNCSRCLAWYHLACLGVDSVSDDWACCGPRAAGMFTANNPMTLATSPSRQMAPSLTMQQGTNQIQLQYNFVNSHPASSSSTPSISVDDYHPLHPPSDISIPLGQISRSNSDSSQGSTVLLKVVPDEQMMDESEGALSALQAAAIDKE